jgi:ABC-type branched-subunit amino acid transport system ATPase component
MTQSLLHVENITVRFGGIVALDHVSLDVERGSIQAVIGPNGAGKSTMLNVITGLYAVEDGAVSFEGERIDGRPSHTIGRMGIARTFQNTELFGEMSAIENVRWGSIATMRTILQSACCTARAIGVRKSRRGGKRRSCWHSSALPTTQPLPPRPCRSANNGGWK